MLYETQWESLRHRRIKIPFAVSKYPDPVDQAIQDAEYPTTNYGKIFHSQIEDRCYSDVNVRFSEDELTHLHGGAEYIKEYDPSLNSSYANVSFLSDILVDIDHGIYVNSFRKTYQSQIESLSYIDANVPLQNPELTQFYGEPEQTKEDIHGSYLHCTIMTPLSDADVVLTHAQNGTAITDFTQLQKYQTEKQTFEVSDQFNILSKREDNWDERGSLKPTDLTLAHAKKVIDASLNSIISAGYQCDTPFISSDGYGNVTAVWYRNERELHFQIGEQEAEYFRVWGTNIDTEMDVDFLKPEDYPSHWKWLIDE